jgi:hypothetical protein
MHAARSGNYSVKPNATCENPASAYVTSPVIALDNDEK